MEEMNTGLPPDGEAGLMTDNSDYYPFSYWDGSHVGLFEDSIARAIERANDGEREYSFSPTRYRWLTFAEVTAAGISEDEARKMVHKSMLPEAHGDGWGPWIEWNGGDCPIPDATAGEWCTRVRRGAIAISDQDAGDDVWRHFRCESDIVAYCVKLKDKPTAAPAKAAKNASIPADYIAWDGKTPHPNLPAGTSIRYMLRGGALGSSQLHGVAWSHTGGPGDVIAYRPLHDGDLKMLLRDSAEHKPRPIAAARVDDAASRKAMLEAGQRYLRGMRDEAVSAAAWVESPRDHRLGRFN